MYIYNSSSKTYEYYGKTATNSITITGLKATKTYKIKVRAYRTFHNVNYYGSYSSILTTATSPAQVTGVKSSGQTTNSITVSWNKVSGATGYRVYYSRYSTVTSKKVTGTSATITGLDTANFYKIYVKAYYTANGENYYGTKSAIISQKTKSTSTIKAGIDVSQHQGTINWNKVKDAGVEFAILRLGWIGNEDNHTIDTKFVENYNACKKLNIPIGVYVYNYCKSTTTAKEGAEWAIDQLEGKTLELPVYIDMEDSSISGLGKIKLTAIATEFNSVIEANGLEAGLQSGVYANKNWFDNKLDTGKIPNQSLWIARYNETTNYEGSSYNVYQYSSKGTINGISGNVDLDVKYN